MRNEKDRGRETGATARVMRSSRLSRMTTVWCFIDIWQITIIIICYHYSHNYNCYYTERFDDSLHYCFPSSFSFVLFLTSFIYFTCMCFFVRMLESGMITIQLCFAMDNTIAGLLWQEGYIICLRRASCIVWLKYLVDVSSCLSYHVSSLWVPIPK